MTQEEFILKESLDLKAPLNLFDQDLFCILRIDYFKTKENKPPWNDIHPYCYVPATDFAFMFNGDTIIYDNELRKITRVLPTIKFDKQIELNTTESDGFLIKQKEELVRDVSKINEFDTVKVYHDEYKRVGGGVRWQVSEIPFEKRLLEANELDEYGRFKDGIFKYTLNDYNQLKREYFEFKRKQYIDNGIDINSPVSVEF